MRIQFLSVSLFLFVVSISCNARDKKHNQETNPKLSHQLFTSKTATEDRNIQVALLLDTSNSMDGLIDQAKAQLWEIVNELSYAKCGTHKINLQIALYEYGNSGLSKQNGYIRQVIPFSDDLDEISKELFALTTDGGDEYCGQVIQTAMKKLDWTSCDDHLKLIFIAGNEAFTQGPIDYRDVTADAEEKGITINTIFCGNYQQGIQSNWSDGASRTGGEYTAIDHNQETVHIVTPYDDVILKLNQKLNDTYIYYGRHGAQKRMLQAEQDRNAKSYSAANAVSRTISKSSGFYKNKSWDLVDAEAEEDFNLEEIKEEQLPQELQNKSIAEKKAVITEKSNERKKIQEEIQEINKKRASYIKEQKKDSDNGLETALIKAIKKQGQKKDFSW